MRKSHVHFFLAAPVLLLTLFSLTFSTSLSAQTEPYCTCEAMEWRVYVAVGTILRSDWLMFEEPSMYQESPTEATLAFDTRGITIRVDTPAVGERVRIWASCDDADYFASMMPGPVEGYGLCIIKWVDAQVTMDNLAPLAMKDREVFGLHPNADGYIESRGRAGVKGAQFLYYREFTIIDPEAGSASLLYEATSHLAHPDLPGEGTMVTCCAPIKVSIKWADPDPMLE